MEIEHSATLSLQQLEQSLGIVEALWGMLTGLKIKKEKTVSVHDNTTRVAAKSLVLKFDPSGTEIGPSGTALICRGTALVSGVETRVAAFRKVEA